MIEIRPYLGSDEQAVAGLWREVFPNEPPWRDPESDIARKLTVQPELFFLAADGDKIVGTAMSGFDGHRGWVYYVAVHPSHRRRGIGHKLMDRVERCLAERGCPKLNLQIRGSDTEAKAFYERLGYRVEDRVSMGKLLQPDEENAAE
jgi:ribosomal protein S18 acetylase RimI-like enzyme